MLNLLSTFLVNIILMKLKTITAQIEVTALKLFEENSEGIKWSELNKTIHNLHLSFHPKTINGTL